MAAFGTAKPGSELQRQLSFPAVYSEAYADLDKGKFAFQPTQMAVKPAEMVTGDDLWTNYHRLKRDEANKRVMNAVKDTRMAINRALVSKNGYWMMPKAVLGQRIYANPSLGATADIYSARPLPDGLRGGVLRSKQGQEYGQKLLHARIAQLDAMDSAYDQMMMGAPVSERIEPFAANARIQTELPETGVGSMVKLVTLISQLADAFNSGEPREMNRFALKDVGEMMLLLFRLAPSMNREELENILEAFGEIRENARVLSARYEDYAEADAATIEGESLAEAQRNQAYASTLVSLTARLYDYIRQMYGAVNKSTKDRQTLSRSLVRSLKLDRYINETNRYLSMVGESAELPARSVSSRSRRSTPFDDDEDGQGWDGVVLRPNTARFTAPAVSREDSEMPLPTAFTSDQRQTFGYRSGAFFGEDESAAAAPNPVNTMNTFRMRAAPADRAEAAAREAPMALTLPAANRRGVRALPSMGSVTRDIASYFTAPEANESAPASVRTASTAPARRRGRTRAVASESEVSSRVSGTPTTASTATASPVTTSSSDSVGNEIARATIGRRINFGRGKKSSGKKWIQEVVAKMKKGAFTKQALRKDETPKEYAKEVLEHPEKHTKTTRRRAQFIENVRPKKLKLLNGSGKVHRGAYHQMEDGTYHSGAKHSKRSKPLVVAE